MIYDVIIVGAGAAGLFAAANIMLLDGQKGLIINKAKSPGLKLLMSGAGQCNLTHDGDMRDYITHYGLNGKKIRSVLYNFNNKNTCAWFESHGVSMHTRSDGKVFPESMNAKDILDVLLEESQLNGFKLVNNTSVTGILPDSGDECYFEIIAEESDSNGRIRRSYSCRMLIIACGGASYPSTGSDGSIFSSLKEIDIDLVELRPALVPLNVENYSYTEIAGNAVRNAMIYAYEGKHRKKDAVSISGDILFTHRNFSGPAVLDISRYIKPGMMIEINWLPSISSESIYAELNSMRVGSKKKTITVLNEYFTRYSISDAMLRLLCRRAEILPDIKFSDLSRNSLKKFIGLVKEDRFMVSGTVGYKMAMSTAGGVNLTEIDLNTMQSKRYKGLYFAGEVTDIDGDTGGYNIQYAFSSAYRAALSVMSNIR